MYSQIIAWLKILLPLGALALLSTIFLLSRDINPIAQVPVLSGGIDPLDSEQVSTAFFAGTTQGGNAMTVEAKRARAGGDDGTKGIEAEDLRVLVTLESGDVMEVQAKTGSMDTGADRVTLTGGVEITSTNGYVMTTEGLHSAIDTVNMESAGPVQAVGPATQIDAGQMRVSEDGENGDVRILFTEGVKLIYTPQVTGADE